jgi:hypothetical protein
MTRSLRKRFAVPVVLTVLSCGQSSGFGGGSSPTLKNPPANLPPSSGNEDGQKTESDHSEDHAAQQTKPAPTQTVAQLGPRIQNFKFGPSQVTTDYVLIIDNSGSMNSILQRVKNGIQSVIEKSPNVFPPNSRMAVMSTMIGAAPSYSTTGAGINRYQGIDLEPGFLSFVNAAQIRAYKAGVRNRADEWPLNGCEQEWFKPSEKDGSNNYCFTAALQITGASVDVEAGIHAFRQLLEKNKNKQIFRPNALVNIVFVSDTHDPGANNRELVNSRPRYADIVNFIKTTANKDIGGLKFHALAPINSTCSIEAMHDKAYLKIASESGGEQADACAAGTDYVEFFRKMSASSVKKEPVFSLEKPAAKVVSIKVGNALVKDFKVSESGDVVTIPGLAPTSDVDIVIEYQPK